MALYPRIPQSTPPAAIPSTVDKRCRRPWVRRGSGICEKKQGSERICSAVSFIFEPPSLTFLLIGWFSPAEEAKRPICSGFLRFRPERKGVYTNRPGNGPTEECEKPVQLGRFLAG